MEEEYLYSKLRTTSVTIILITPQAVNHKKDSYGYYDDWMYDEIRYSLEDRENNRCNGLVAVYTKEAMPLLEKYLDDAYAAKMTSVRIVHGIGTGRLKMAVHNKLKKLSFVKDYHLANYDDGGSAITIVELQT